MSSSTSSSSSKTYFITGTNRGIGFQLVSQLITKFPNSTILATVRDPSKESSLTKLASSNSNIHIIKLDITSLDSIHALPTQLDQLGIKGIDTVISNAAIADSYTTILETNPQVWLNHYTTNVLGPIELTKILYPYLKLNKFKQIIFTSSVVGSLSAFFPVSTSAYGQSKAALNHTVLSLSNELGPEGFTVIAVHPGAVKTDMGNYGLGLMSKNHPEVGDWIKENSITVEKSAEEQINNVICKLDGKNGKFLSYTGEEIPY